MEDFTLTADQLNYVDQPLKNLVVKLRENLDNIAKGLRNKGYSVEEIVAANPPFDLREYRNNVDNLSNDDLFVLRDQLVQQWNQLRILSERRDPTLVLRYDIKFVINDIDNIKDTIISQGDQDKKNKLNDVLIKPDYINYDQIEDDMEILKMKTLIGTLKNLRREINAIVTGVPVTGVTGGSINRKTKRRKTKGRKMKRRKTKRRKN